MIPVFSPDGYTLSERFRRGPGYVTPFVPVDENERVTSLQVRNETNSTGRRSSGYMGPQLSVT